MAAFHPRTRLDSFVEGALSPSSRARVSAHLADCEECRREVGQRERILRAAFSLPPAPGRAPDRSAADGGRHGSLPVLERRAGVAGWKVVLGFGAVGLLTSGVLMSAWVAGEPRSGDSDAVQSQLLSFAGGAASAARNDAGHSPLASPTGSSTGTAGSPVPARTPGTTPADESDRGFSSVYLAPAGSILSTATGMAPAAVVELTPPMVTGLRQSGWNVPTFHGFGLPRESTDWRRAEGIAEVVMTLADDGHTLEFHECRALGDREPAPSCPVGWIRSGGSEDSTTGAPAATGQEALGNAAASLAEAGTEPVTGPLSWAGADVVRLPVGVDMRLRERADGSWTAALTTAQAGYAVDSDLPVEDAARVMSMVVISERSRVQGGSVPESPGDRLARGFERILPWTGVTEPERR